MQPGPIRVAEAPAQAFVAPGRTIEDPGPVSAPPADQALWLAIASHPLGPPPAPRRTAIYRETGPAAEAPRPPTGPAPDPAPAPPPAPPAARPAGPPVDLPTRLCAELGWTRAQAQAGLAEYRRFAYLSQVAGHVVVPSEAVDQVWHAHLMWTRDYWGPWCHGVLRRPLHHTPNPGGVAENARHHDGYQRTLEAYTRHFGSAPPADWWPPTGQRFGVAWRHVDAAGHWIVPVPAAWRACRRAWQALIHRARRQGAAADQPDPQ